MQKVQKKLDAYFEKDAKFNLDNNLVLKFKNIESYLYGKEQLIYFQEVRDFLRKAVSDGG